MKTKLRILQGLLVVMLLLGGVMKGLAQNQEPTQTVCPGIEDYYVVPGDEANSFQWTITPATGWTIIPGADDWQISVNWANPLVQTDYTVTLRETNATCYTEVSVIVTVNPAPDAPAVGLINQPTCLLATGSVELSGLPTGNWTINPGAITGTGATTTISSLVAGTYNFTVTNSVGCISVASADVVINTQPATPDAPVAGLITQPTCLLATGSVELSGLPTGNWTINPGAITGTGATTTISGLVAGTYNFTVTNSVGCISVASADVVINTQPATPDAPIVGLITQPTCLLATGSVELSGLPTGNWTINPGAITGTGATTTISGLVAGTYNFTVTNSVGCISVASADVVINTQPETPAAPSVSLTQPTCDVATGTITVDVPTPDGFITYTVTGTNPVVASVTNDTGVFTGLASGVYDVTTTNAAGCTSSATSVTINTQPASPSTSGIWHN